MDEHLIGTILQRVALGQLGRDDAVKQLIPLIEKYGGLASAGGSFTPDQQARLNDLGKALSWEMAKRSRHSAIPDVPYDSPDYRAFLASIPRTTDDDAEGGGTA